MMPYGFLLRIFKKIGIDVEFKKISLYKEGSYQLREVLKKINFFYGL